MLDLSANLMPACRGVGLGGARLAVWVYERRGRAREVFWSWRSVVEVPPAPAVPGCAGVVGVFVAGNWVRRWSVGVGARVWGYNTTTGDCRVRRARWCWCWCGSSLLVGRMHCACLVVFTENSLNRGSADVTR